MNDYYYISYRDNAEFGGRLPTDICLTVLEDDFDIIEKYLNDYFKDRLNSCKSYGLQIINGWLYEEVTPALISNDRRFLLRYKGVFSLRDFKYFCGIYAGSFDNLWPHEKAKVNLGNPNRRQAYEYLEKLINGEGTLAYEYEAYEKEYDDDGNNWSVLSDSGWRIIFHKR